MPRTVRHLLLPLAIALLAGCGSDAPPADRTADKDQHTELRDAIQRPLDKARAVDATVQKAKEQQDKDIENQVNGQAPDAKSGDDKSGDQ
jgi:outer membrane biogenesis lipoprotein LolB